jgi:hypothetical protein
MAGVLLAGTILGACGGPGNTTSTSRGSALVGSPIPPCKVMTRADASAALGFPVRAGINGHGNELDPTQGGSCTYYPKNRARHGSVVDRIFVHSHGEQHSPQQVFAALQASRPGTKPVAGIAQGAFYLGQGKGKGELLFLRSPAIVQLTIDGGSQADSLAPLTRLAKEVAAKMATIGQ